MTRRAQIQDMVWAQVYAQQFVALAVREWTDEQASTSATRTADDAVRSMPYIEHVRDDE